MTKIAQIRREFDEWERRRNWIRSADADSLSEVYEAWRPFILSENRAFKLQELIDMKRQTNTPRNASDIPATKGMLEALEGKLMAEIRGSTLKMTSQFKGLESKFEGLESRFHGLESKFHALESRFLQVESKMDKTLAVVEDIRKMINESQMMKESDYSMNRSVIDGYVHVAEEVRELKGRVEKLEEK